MALPAISLSREEFEQLVLDDPDRPWEIIRGQLQEKPAMSFAHNDGACELGYSLRSQLNRRDYLVRINTARLFNPLDTYVIPDVVVIPIAAAARFRERPLSVEIYPEPMPLLAEFLSPSTGKYGVEGKLEAYKARGDREIWIVHPEMRTLTAWRRRDDGGYEELVIRGGSISPIALPEVVISLANIFVS
jgi:Uma2 family endonuclease